MRFSCIIRTFNPRADWLVRAVESAVGLFDEIVLVDDGSTNKTVPVAWSIGETKIKIVRHDKNMGVCEARNTGVRTASGDIIAWLDDDDYFEQEGVLALKRFIEDNQDCDVYHFLLKMFGEPLDEGHLYGESPDLSSFGEHNPIPGVSWHTKKLWEELGGYQYPNGEDWDFFARAWKEKKVFVYYPKVVYNVNRRKESTSMSYVGETFDKMRADIKSRNNL